MGKRSLPVCRLRLVHEREMQSMIRRLGLEIPMDAVADFCRRWQVTELSLFGSAMRDDFSLDSDVDLLASFDETTDWDLFDLADMQDELTEIIGRKVDLIPRDGIEESHNAIRREAILNSAAPIYVAE